MRSNYRAARRGRSRAEFAAKLGTVFEEADECVDCLTYFRDTGIRHDAGLLQEAEELARIFGAAARTARGKRRSGEREDRDGRDADEE